MKGLLTKTNIAIGLAVVLLAAVLIAATTGGIGKDSVPSDAVAVIDGKPISKDEFNRAMQQAALQQGGNTVPAPGDPSYAAIRDAALGDLFDAAWIRGEAADRGIVVTDTQIQQQLETTKKQNFKTDAEYQKFLEQSGFTQADVDQRVELQLLSQEIQKEIAGQVPAVSDQEVSDFYSQNKKQFEQPQQRDLRLILNQDKAKVEQARKLLEADSSDANWKKVAAEFSTDQASKDNGGVRQAVTPGVLEGDLDAAVFDAPLNQISDVVQTPLGYYIFEVTKDTPGGTQPLAQVSAQLKQQLQSQKQQELFSAFIEDYRSKWSDLTICAGGFVIDRCDNFVTGAAQPCTDQQRAQTGCPAFVPPRSPVAPGLAGVAALGGSSSGAPQRPHPPGEGAAAPSGLPPGISGAPGAPGAGGAAPSGATAAPPSQ